VVKTIVAAAELKPRDAALEIGPGKGALTGELLGREIHLKAIELDKTLARELQERFKGCARFELIQADILKTNLGALFAPSQTPIKVFGNLPYSIASPIFEKLMPWAGWDVGIFLIQREVAERIASLPGSRAYGILSLAVQLFAEAETLLQVNPGAFHPPPQVSSTVIRLRRKEHPELPRETIPDFFEVVHGAFAHRRKTIANSLAYFSGMARWRIESWLLEQKVPPGARAETIALADYAKLAAAWSIFRRETNLTSPAARSTIPNT